MDNLNPELLSILESSSKLRKVLEQALPRELTDYLLHLVAKDISHRKFLKRINEAHDA